LIYSTLDSGMVRHMCGRCAILCTSHCSTVLDYVQNRNKIDVVWDDNGDLIDLVMMLFFTPGGDFTPENEVLHEQIVVADRWIHSTTMMMIT
jgi:hypothetical protein